MPGPYDVFLLAGQSNHKYGDPLDTALDLGHARVFQWGRIGANDGQVIAATEPLEHWSPDAGRIGFALAMMRDWYVPRTLASDRNVLLVPAAANGTSFSSTDWRVGDGLYLDAVARANAAMATDPANRFGGILWSLGENDALAAMSEATFAAHLDDVIDGMRSEITDASSAPFIVGGMTVDWVGVDADRLAIKAALIDTPNRRMRCAYVSSAGLTSNSGDSVHFSAASQRGLRAQRFYEALLSVIQPAPSRTLSTTALNSMADEQTDEVWLVLMTIEHDDLEEALRVVSNIEEIVSQGETYVALPFEIELPGDGTQGPTEARIKVDNVDKQIVEAIRTIQTPPSITLSVVLASALDEPELTIENMTLRNASYDVAAVSGTLQFEDLTLEPIAEKITPDRFPALF